MPPRSKKPASLAVPASPANPAESRATGVLIGRGAIGQLAHDLPGPAPLRAVLVTDAGVPRRAVTSATRAIRRARLRVTHVQVRASEKQKSLATVERILEAASAAGVERSDLFVSMGGGITTDLTGLAASLHRRGCRVIHCPTTLLAMVDGAVGGKTAANLRVGDHLHKNAVGTFHPPARVVCDPELLRSLPARHFRSGLAECIKHGLIGSGLEQPDLLGMTAGYLEHLTPGYLDTAEGLERTTELIAANVSAKGFVVAQDPTESRADLPGGGRMALNLGHTFAHAIETLGGLRWQGGKGPLTHGEAVGLGLICAAGISADRGLCVPELCHLTALLVGLAGLPVEVAGLPSDRELYQRMLADKKTSAGKLRLIGFTDERRAEVIAGATLKEVARAFARIRL